MIKTRDNSITFKRVCVWALLYVLLLLVLFPHFTNMLRIVQFDTIRRDNYENLLLVMLGKGDMTLEFAPRGHRILNVAAAIPFYPLPLFLFRNIHHTHPEIYSLNELRALQALTLLNYCSMVALMVLLGFFSRYRVGHSPLETLVVMSLSFVLSMFSGWYSLDIPVILYTTVVLFTLHRPSISWPLLALSALFNEKIFIIYSLLFVVRIIFVPSQRRTHAIFLLSCVLAGALYFLITRLIPLPLARHQEQLISRFLATIFNNIQTTLTVRGFFHSILPLTLLSCCAYAHTMALRTHPSIARALGIRGHTRDGWVIPGYVAVIAITSVQHNIGRIVMILYPLYIFGAASFIGQRIGALRPRMSVH